MSFFVRHRVHDLLKCPSESDADRLIKSHYPGDRAMLRRFISALVIAMMVVLAPAGAAYAGPTGADHREQPCVSIECADGPGAGAGTGGADGRMGIAATGPTSFPYLAIAGGLVVAGVAAIVVSRIRTRQS
jgi:hypothetical protein